MDYLHLYNPENDNACIKVFNILDAYLEEKSAPVVLSAAKLFYTFIIKLKTNSQLGILKDFMLKISPQITRFLKGHTNQDFQYSVMNFLYELSNEAFLELMPLRNQFYFKLKDLTNCMKIKAKILFRFCELNIKNGSELGNANDIIDYLLSQLPYQSSIRNELVSYLCQVSMMCKETSDTKTALYRYDFRKV